MNKIDKFKAVADHFRKHLSLGAEAPLLPEMKE